MGLQLLERERKLFVKDKVTQPDLAGYEYVIGRQLKPEIPVSTLSELKKEEIRPTSMIDVTDGLASDLLHVCRLSGQVAESSTVRYRLIMKHPDWRKNSISIYGSGS